MLRIDDYYIWIECEDFNCPPVGRLAGWEITIAPSSGKAKIEGQDVAILTLTVKLKLSSVIENLWDCHWAVIGGNGIDAGDATLDYGADR